MQNQVTKLVLKLLLIVVPLVTIIFVVNVSVDPGYYTVRSVEKFSNALNSGKDVHNYPLELSFRKLHEATIRDPRFHAKVICVGSSRAWQIDHTLFPGTTFYNASVGSANLKDVIAIYYLLKQQNKLPDTLIVSIDPWEIDNSRGENLNTHAFTVYSYYYRSVACDLGLVKKYKLFTPKMLLSRYIHPNIIELTSFSYFQSSIDKIFNGHRENYSMAKGVDDTCRILYSDGSLEYPKSFNELREDSVIAMAKHFAEQEFNPGVKVSQTNMQLLVSFVELLKKDGITPILFLSPYHPIPFDKIDGSSHCLSDDEIAVKEIARKEGVACIGTYSPYACNFSTKDFYDYYHVKKKSISSLFAHGMNEIERFKKD